MPSGTTPRGRGACRRDRPGLLTSLRRLLPELHKRQVCRFYERLHFVDLALAGFGLESVFDCSREGVEGDLLFN
jgi:hypothetical protein